MKHVACNLCGANTARPLFSGYDRLFPQHTREYTLCQCARCGLVYLNPRPETSEELAEIYPPTYESYMQRRQRLMVMLRQLAWGPEIKEIVRLTRPESPILEIGSATGEFLAAIRRRGRNQLTGIELSEQAASEARRRYQLDVRTGDLLHIDFAGQRFEVVIMRHALEHVPDPCVTLKTISALLQPGGYAVFTIPNVDSHTAGLFGRNWYGYEVPRHFYLFPGRTLDRYFAQTGLQRLYTHHVATPNVWIGSFRFILVANGYRRASRFFRYGNPLALLITAPLGLASAKAASAGVIRVIAQKVQ